MPIAGPASTPHDARNPEAGVLLVGTGAILLFVSLFLEWFQRGLDAFEVFEVWDLVLATLALTALAAVASRLGFGPARPASWLVGPACAALVIVLFALLNPPPVAAGIDDDPSTGLWLALAASVLMVAGVVMSVARISVAFAPAPGRLGDPMTRRHAGAAEPAVHPADPRAGAVADPTAIHDPDGPRGSRRFGRGTPPVDGQVDPVAPTEPTRRI